jgi:hypothetical protein
VSASGGPPADGSTGEPSSADAVEAALDAGPGAPPLAGPALDAGSEAGAEDVGRVPNPAIAVVTGDFHVCVILADHKVKCWGSAAYGQLGYGDTRTRGGTPADMGDALPFVDLGTGRSALGLAAGHYATCAILDDASLKCWGMGGLNGTSRQIGGGPGEMGDQLAPLDLGGRKAVHVAISENVACASMDDQSIWCWDQMTAPRQVYDGGSSPSVAALSADGGDVMALFDDGSVVQRLGGGAPSPLYFGGKVVAISGSIGPCAVLDDGTIVRGPIGTWQQTGLPTGAFAIATESQTSNGLCALYGDGSVRCGGIYCGPANATPTWCENNRELLALGEPATALSSGGATFGCALLESGGVKCWAGPPSLAPPWLGSSVSFDDTNGFVWSDIDLGSHE